MQFPYCEVLFSLMGAQRINYRLNYHRYNCADRVSLVDSTETRVQEGGKLTEFDRWGVGVFLGCCVLSPVSSLAAHFDRRESSSFRIQCENSDVLRFRFLSFAEFLIRFLCHNV
ncbi:hypothetical protein M758_2G041400 [Ceratodon purpureus]|uniref:Uncharacterized protein n=1 Tax=Ceratodon purpureus TaxID=3225 RepID=A0A8T0ISS5_CERPU|nr:hypothetical protein KC19_2G042100 [Ceratodon purpureus]KAG0625269.1 hypothetical protein M758_2G041400 [Ceratodon purpureus]